MNVNDLDTQALFCGKCNHYVRTMDYCPWCGSAYILTECPKARAKRIEDAQKYVKEVAVKD
jgi:DNA polymerase II large subunit